MKKLFSLLLAMTMLLSIVPAAIATGFSDVESGAWYYDAVNYVVSNKLMNGYSATEFGVNDTLSRAMIAQILFNKAGQPAVAGAHSFNDVASGDWFNNAVTWITRKGIMNGYGNGKFAPNDNVTLEQIAVILWNYSGTPAFTASANSLGAHSDWATNALGWAVENGIFENIPFGAVTEKATRAQTAQMLTNYLTSENYSVTKITDHGYVLSIPTKYVDLVTVDGWEVDEEVGITYLFDVSHKASHEAAKAYYGDGVGYGFLFDIFILDDEDELSGFTSVDTVFAKDDKGNFFLCTWAGDVPFFALDKNGKPVDPYTQDLSDLPEYEEFNTLLSWTSDVLYTFIEDNGLTPYFRDTTYLPEILYQLANGNQTTVLKHSSGQQHQTTTLPSLKSLPRDFHLNFADAKDVPTGGIYISLHTPGWFGDYTYDFFLDENAQHVVRVNIPATRWSAAHSEYYTIAVDGKPYPIGKAILACWDELTGNASTSTVTGISLDITSHKMGEDWTQYLTATLSPAGVKDTITWTSSNPKVATVNEKGKVSGVAGGEAIITATTSNGKTASCKIEVWHSHKLTKTTAATCTAAGNETYTCTFCGHSYDKYLPPLGGSHKWSSGTCTRCKASAYDYNAVAPVTSTGYKGYDMLLGEYSHAMSLGSASAVEHFYNICTKQGGGEHFSEYLVTEQLAYNDEITYSLYDIDANGTPELLVGDSYQDTFLLYALDSAGNVVYINESMYNYPLYILTNGRILLEGHMGAMSGYYTLVRLGANGKTSVLETYGFDPFDSGPNMISENAWNTRVNKLKKDSVMGKLKWVTLP